MQVFLRFLQKIPCTGGYRVSAILWLRHYFASLKNSDLPIISAFSSLITIHILQHYLAKLINIAVDLIPVALTLHQRLPFLLLRRLIGLCLFLLAGAVIKQFNLCLQAETVEELVWDKEHQVCSAFNHTFCFQLGSARTHWPALDPPNGPLTLIRYMN